MKTNKVWKRNGYLIRSVELGDAKDYYQQVFCPLDPEIVRLTGCKEVFSEEEVLSFIHQSVDDEERYMFLILSPDGDIVGETVVNKIDLKLRSANFRMGIFNSSHRNQGIGSWAVKVTRDFAFEELKLHRLELDVFSFNPRAKQCYLNAGFKVEGVLRDAIMENDTYADDIMMAILEDEWKENDNS